MVEIPLSNFLAGMSLQKVLVRIFLQRFFGSDFFKDFWVNTFSSEILDEIPLQSFLVESYSITLLRFLVRISLQRFCGSDFSLIKDF